MVENVLQARSSQAIVQQKLGSYVALPAAWWKAHTGLSPALISAPEHRHAGKGQGARIRAAQQNCCARLAPGHWVPCFLVAVLLPLPQGSGPFRKGAHGAEQSPGGDRCAEGRSCQAPQKSGGRAGTREVGTHCQGTQGFTGVQQLDTGEQSVDANRRWDAGAQGSFLRVNGRKMGSSGEPALADPLGPTQVQPAGEETAMEARGVRFLPGRSHVASTGVGRTRASVLRHPTCGT